MSQRKIKDPTKMSKGKMAKLIRRRTLQILQAQEARKQRDLQGKGTMEYEEVTPDSVYEDLKRGVEMLRPQTNVINYEEID